MRCNVVSILLDAYKFKFVPLHVSIKNNNKIKKLVKVTFSFQPTFSVRIYLSPSHLLTGVGMPSLAIPLYVEVFPEEVVGPNIYPLVQPIIDGLYQTY